MKLDKNIIIAGLCGVIIGAGGFALIDKPKQRAFHNPHHQFARHGAMPNAPMHTTLKNMAKAQQRQVADNRPQRQMQNMEEVFAKLDTNSDNKLDSSEVKNGVLAHNFENFDTNKDGIISIEEFEVIKKHHAHNSPRQRHNNQCPRPRQNRVEG